MRSRTPLVICVASLLINSAPAQQLDRNRVLPLVVQQVGCYAVCDTLVATFSADLRVTRAEYGQVLGRGRIPARVFGGDTISVDTAAFDSLLAALDRYLQKGFPADTRQGSPPCSAIRATHAAVYRIEWQEGKNRRSIRFDSGCNEPSGLLRALAARVTSTARFVTSPVRRR